TVQERKQCHPRDAVPALPAARVHVPVPVAGRVGGVLGQPGDLALRARRLRASPPVRAPGDAARRPAVRAGPAHGVAPRHRRMGGDPDADAATWRRAVAYTISCNPLLLLATTALACTPASGCRAPHATE